MRRRQQTGENGNGQQIDTTPKAVFQPQLKSPDTPLNYLMTDNQDHVTSPTTFKGEFTPKQPLFGPVPTMGIPLPETFPLISDSQIKGKQVDNPMDLNKEKDLNQSHQTLERPQQNPDRLLFARDSELFPVQQQRQRVTDGSEIPLYRVNMRDVETYHNSDNNHK